MARQPSNDRNPSHDENLNWNNILKTEASSSQKTRRILLIIAVIVSFGIAFNNGVYEFSAQSNFVVHKYNKFTGDIEVCLPKKGCEPIKDLK